MKRGGEEPKQSATIKRGESPLRKKFVYRTKQSGTTMISPIRSNVKSGTSGCPEHSVAIQKKDWRKKLKEMGEERRAMGSKHSEGKIKVH